MKLIIGLGNPGEKYTNSRHNTGYMFVDELRKNKLPKDVVIKKSNSFMNESGSCINVLLHEYKVDPSDLYVIHDDLDIPLGSYKIQYGKGPKDHNGILDIEDKLGTKDFWRVRVGIDNRPLDNKISGEVYTLEDFTGDERKILNEVVKRITRDLVSKITIR